jgi:hypothetical protein
MAQEKTTIAKRSGGKHFSISEIHRAALGRLVAELRELYPEKKGINASSTLEWMIEKICGKSDYELKEYMELRSKMAKINK